LFCAGGVVRNNPLVLYLLLYFLLIVVVCFLAVVAVCVMIVFAVRLVALSLFVVVTLAADCWYSITIILTNGIMTGYHVLISCGNLSLISTVLVTICPSRKKIILYRGTVVVAVKKAVVLLYE
jgi:hypothetical protein